METIYKTIDWIQGYEVWVKWLVGIWFIITAAVIVVLIISPKRNEKEETMTITHYWHLTGDEKIDNVLKELNHLEQKGRRYIKDSELSEAISPLFSRPAFYNIKEENWEYFLYPLCKSRLILEHYQSYFTSSHVRSQISQAVHKMVILQNDVARIYGKNFKIDEHIREYINDSRAFIDNLPNQKIEPDMMFFNDRDETIKEINKILAPIDLAQKIY